MKYVATQTALAEALGRAQSTIAEMKKKGAPIKRTRRGYAVEPVEKWIAENLRAPSRPPGRPPKDVDERAEGSLRQKLIREQIRERAATANLKEFQARLQSGDLIPREDIEKEERAKTAIIRRGLMNFPRATAPLLVGLDHREIEAIMMKKVRELLERFARS
jgi:phage terminase Nu1 subunit (DNA packaging protein)